MRDRFIERLVHKGGPDIDDDAEFEAWLDRTASDLNSGRMTKQDLMELRSSFRDALSVRTMQGFALTKPHGYPGDFEIIDRIYNFHMTEDPALRRWDEYFHRKSAPKAVRNRKEYFKNLLDRVEGVASGVDGPIKVLNVASGPARDVYEYFRDRGSNSRIHIDCLDHDSNAIAYASELCSGFSSNVSFHQGNAFKFVPEKRYRLVWCAGLFDYLDDKAFKFLLARLLRVIDESGELVIGNFSDKNPTRNYMEIMGEWFLTYRSRRQLLSLAMQPGVSQQSLMIESEDESVNLFLHIPYQTNK